MLVAQIRLAAGVLAALALTACDSGTVPNPAEAERAPTGSVIAEGQVDLRGDGLAAGPEAFYFAAGRNEVEQALARSLGTPTGRSTNPECVAGTIDFTDFSGGLAVHFKDDRLVGWNWRLLQDGDQPAQGVLRLSSSAVQVGSTRSTAEQAQGFAPITASTLGEEFSIGARIGGFIENDAVVMLYAGTQCFFR